jgi:hypothetical protein
MRSPAASPRGGPRDIRLVVAGDVNVAPTDADVFHPRRSRASPTSRRPSGRRSNGSSRRGSWTSTSLGGGDGAPVDVVELRDRVLAQPRHADRHDRADAQLAARLDTTWIDHVERGAEKPSDHAALIADFHPA